MFALQQCLRICVLCNHMDGIHHVTYIETSASLVVEQAYVDEAQYMDQMPSNQLWYIESLQRKINELILNIEEDENTLLPLFNGILNFFQAKNIHLIDNLL